MDEAPQSACGLVRFLSISTSPLEILNSQMGSRTPERRGEQKLKANAKCAVKSALAMQKEVVYHDMQCQWTLPAVPCLLLRK